MNVAETADQIEATAIIAIPEMMAYSPLKLMSHYMEAIKMISNR